MTAASIRWAAQYHAEVLAELAQVREQAGAHPAEDTLAELDEASARVADARLALLRLHIERKKTTAATRGKAA